MVLDMLQANILREDTPAGRKLIILAIVRPQA